jgi:hypothetical protein
LRSFDLTLKEIEPSKLLRKIMNATDVQARALVLDFPEPLDSEILRELLQFLRYLGIPEEEVRRLRLAEPGEILAHEWTEQNA